MSYLLISVIMNLGPVCFSRSEIAKILEFKVRCQKQNKKCELDKKEALIKATGQINLEKKILKTQLDACIKQGCKKQFWVGFGVGASVVTVGVLVTVIVLAVKGIP